MDGGARENTMLSADERMMAVPGTDTYSLLYPIINNSIILIKCEYYMAIANGWAMSIQTEMLCLYHPSH